MPRYYFHFTDGDRVLTDRKGREFPGLRAARAHAVVTLRETKAALCENEVRDLSGWSLRVTDAAGRIVFALGFDLRPRAAPPAPLAEPAGERQAASARRPLPNRET